MRIGPLGSPFRLSNLECFESIFVRGVKIILCREKRLLIFYYFYDEENNKFATHSLKIFKTNFSFRTNRGGMSILLYSHKARQNRPIEPLLDCFLIG